MPPPLLTVFEQGQGVVPADWLNGAMSTCDSVANLRAFTGVDGMSVWMRGTSEPNDGGQGSFYWSSSATAPDDDGVTTIAPFGVTGSGRWIRQQLAPTGSIPLSQIEDIPSNTILGNNTGSSGPVLTLTVSDLLTMLGIVTTTVPPGTVAAFISPTPPTGWLVCDGSAVSRTTYSALNALANTASYAAPWGPGNGTTTFNLPNLLGQFVRGFDSGGSVDPGRTFGTEQEDALQSHKHITDTPSVFISNPYVAPFGDSGVAVLRNGFNTAGTGNQNLGLSNDGTTYSSFNPNPGGQISATETRPTNVALSLIVKY